MEKIEVQNTETNDEMSLDEGDLDSYDNEEARADSEKSGQDSAPRKIIGGNYEVIRQLGQGSQGHVYLAKSLHDQQLVAVKVLRIDSVKNWKQYDLFSRESQTLANLNIQGVARLIESFEELDGDAPCAYIVQEYIDGKTLAEYLNDSERLTKKQIFDIACQLSEILEKIHTHDPVVIHRDLKPGNVMIRKGVDGSDQVYLIDFGAVANPQIQSGGSTVAGTFGYMPPEQLVGNPSPASDIYALGAMVAYMLSGVSPADMQTSNDFRLVIEPHLGGEAPAVISLLRQMLDPNAATRMTDYGMLQRAFSFFSEGKYNIDVGAGCMDYTSEMYSRQLRQVESLWQPGNFSLWQAVPAKTPRSVPLSVKSMNPVLLDSIKPLYENHIFNLDNRQGILRLIVTCAAIFGIIYCIIHIEWLILVAAIPVVWGIAWVFLSEDIRSNVNAQCYEFLKSAKKNWNTKKCEMEKINSETIDKIMRLIEYGNKGIATITKIEFETPCEESIEYYHVDEQDAYYVHNAPVFEIRYKFLPENSKQYVEGVVKTHHCPTGKLIVGDALPILYLNHESMPFPFAFGDMTSKDDVISETIPIQG